MRTHDGGPSGGGVLSEAIIGAAAGALGVWVLDRLDWFMWRRESPETRRRTTAVRPGGEPPAHVAVTKVKRRLGADTSGSARIANRIEHLDTDGLWRDGHYRAGALVHYSLGVGPAAIYSLVRDRLPARGPVRGALYGFALFVAQDEMLNALTGLSGKPRQYPWQAHVRGLIQHLAYGVVTDAAISVMKGRFRPAPTDGRSWRPAPAPAH